MSEDDIDNGGDDQPEVVCLCGSTRFKSRYRAENRRLTMDGKIVLSVGLFGHADDVDLSEDEKQMLDALHKRKIDMADRVHIVHEDGYVGDSTVSEIDYAKSNDTEVTWMDEDHYQSTDGGDSHA